jgi:signal transduction histidine kinase
LNNVLKHAQAQTVFITLQQQDNEVNLHIQDDGKGFDVTQKRNGVGLKNIKSRAEMFNGRVKVQSEPGKGCEVSVNFSTKNIIATIQKEEIRA